MFKRPAEKEAEQRRAIIDLLKESKTLTDKIPDRTNTEKLRVLAIQSDHEQRYRDWPDREKKTRGDEYGKPVQPSTVGNLFGKDPRQKKEEPQKKSAMPVSQ